MTDRIEVGPGACARCDAAAERNLCLACADALEIPPAMIAEQVLSVYETVRIGTDRVGEDPVSRGLLTRWREGRRDA